ncbi:MAG: Fe2+-dependent dioxygenase [Pseudomonadota bacterium]
MILTISAIDDSATLDALRKQVEALSWRDGGATAGKVARAVKRNEQAVLTSAAGKVVVEQLTPAIQDNPVLKAAARPRRFSKLMISKTRDGGHYGAHVDNAMMGGAGNRLRTDLSFTLFLNEPGSYEGGELVVHSAGVMSQIKAKAGQLVLYPSSSIHEVRPVTSGERIVCVGWIESLIADPTQRELLFDLENLRASLRAQLEPQSADLLMLDKSISNLLRMWGTA